MGFYQVHGLKSSIKAAAINVIKNLEYFTCTELFFLLCRIETAKQVLLQTVKT